MAVITFIFLLILAKQYKKINIQKNEYNELFNSYQNYHNMVVRSAINKPAPKSNKNIIDSQTKALILLANGNANEHEARTAAVKACQRLANALR